MKKQKLLFKILSSTKNVKFSEIVLLAEAFGFHLSRVRGSHHIFTHPGISELLNLQDVRGKQSLIRSSNF